MGSKIILLFLLILISPTISIAQTANAGSDKVVLLGEPVVLDGSLSSGGCDGLITDTENHCIRWEIGYGNWDDQGKLYATVAFPITGVFTNTLFVCLANGTCNSDTMTVTVNPVPEGAETIITDSGNPVTNGTNLCNAVNTLSNVNNPVIVLMAGVIYRRNGVACSLVNRTGSGYLTIKSSAVSSLAEGKRVSPLDSINMPILEPGVHGANPALNSTEAFFVAPRGSNPAHHYRFIGLKFRKTLPTVDYGNPRGFIDLGNGSGFFNSINDLPHHFIFDRLYIGEGDTLSATTRAFALAANDVSIMNTYVHRIQGVGLELQAIFVGMGDRITFTNSYLNATTENILFGGADVTLITHSGTVQATGNDLNHVKLASTASSVNGFYVGKGIYLNSGTGSGTVGCDTGSTNCGRLISAYDGATKIATIYPDWKIIPNNTSTYVIGDHVPSFVAIRRNHLQKDICWLSTQPCYYGRNHPVKNMFELKQCRYCTVQANILEDHWMEDQLHSVVLTTRNQDGKQPWSEIALIDFSYNQMRKMGNANNLLGTDNLHVTKFANRLLIRHNIWAGVSFYNGQNSTVNIGGGAMPYAGAGILNRDHRGHEQLYWIRNSWDSNGTGGQGRFEFDNTTNTQSIWVIGNIVQGFFNQSNSPGTPGESALIRATSQFSGSYTVKKNCFYLSSGTNPADNTLVSTRAGVLYNNIAGFDLSLQPTSPCKNVGLAGADAGANTSKVNMLTSGVITGVWGSTCNWHTNPACGN